MTYRCLVIIALANCLWLTQCSKPSPPGLSAATAVFGWHRVTITIPLDAATWGEPVQLDESAGLTVAQQLVGHTSDDAWPPPQPVRGAFGLRAAGDSPYEPIMTDGEQHFWWVDFVIWPKGAKDDPRYMLLDCYQDRADDQGEPISPATAAGQALREQLTRAHFFAGNASIGLSSHEQRLLILDHSLLFEHFIQHAPQQITVYVTLKGRGTIRQSIPVRYDAPPAAATPQGVRID